MLSSIRTALNLLVALLLFVSTLAAQTPPAGRGRPTPSSPLSSQQSRKNRDPSGIYLEASPPNALPYQTKGVFRTPEREIVLAERTPAVGILEFAYAMAGGNNRGAVRRVPEIHFEKDNRGYWTHLYLRPEGEKKLEAALARRQAAALLILGGEFRGRLEPCDQSKNHWAVANIEHMGPGILLTVQINAQIMIAWNESGRIPDAADPGRTEVEHSIRDSVTHAMRAGFPTGLFQEITVADFARMGEPGLALYMSILDSGEFDMKQWANYARVNFPPRQLAYFIRNIKDVEARRSLFMFFPTLARRVDELLDAEDPMVAYLEDVDPEIVVRALTALKPDDLGEKRESVIRQVNAFLRRGQYSSPTPIHNLSEAMIKAHLVECAPGLRDYLIAAPPEELSAYRRIDTLAELGAVDELRDVILARPDIPPSILSLNLRQICFYKKIEQEDIGEMLLTISRAAKDGRWKAPVDSHRTLADAMCGFARFPGATTATAAASPHVRVRAELLGWIGKPGYDRVLPFLAQNQPRPDEKPYYLAGLKSSDLRTVTACIGALARIGATDAMPALVDVLDRKDARKDMYPEYHALSEKERRTKYAVRYGPASMTNIGYCADSALMRLAGIEDRPPPHENNRVLKQRWRFWRNWLKDNRGK